MHPERAYAFAAILAEARRRILGSPMMVPDSSGHAPALCPAMSSNDIASGRRHPCLRDVIRRPDGSTLVLAERLVVTSG